MDQFNILHLTDVHFGQSGHSSYWPNIKRLLFMDLDALHSKCGPVHLIAFTGDIAGRGDRQEYDAADEFLTELQLHLLETTGVLPPVAPVPGNHDVQRIHPASSDQKVLEHLWTHSEESLLFDGNSPDLLAFIRDRFGNYTDWLSRGALELISTESTGFLPGDYVATEEAGGLKVGVLGLNTAYRHLSDAARPGSLSLPAQQAHLAAGGDLVRWSAKHDVCIALTHHPLSWIEEADTVRDVVFGPATRVRVHLCGHLHDERYTLEGLGTASPLLIQQGRSLFGLENFLRADGTELERSHGYSIFTISREPGAALQASLWPRRGERNQTGQLSLDRDSTFGLASEKSQSRGISIDVEVSAIAEGRDVETVAPSGPPSDGAQAADAKAFQELCHLLESGNAVAVVGDRVTTLPDGRFGVPTAHLRERVLEELELPASDDLTTSTTQLAALLKTRNRSKLKLLLGEHYGNPSEEEIAEAADLCRAPWAAVFYLSPNSDFRAQADDPVPGEQYVDATREKFRMPPPASSLRLRLSTDVGYLGSDHLTVGSYSEEDEEENSDLRTWMRFCGNRISRSPVVFLSDAPSLLGLHKWVQRRGSSPHNRPRAFFVGGGVEPHMAALFERHGVQHIPLQVSEFLSRFLRPDQEHIRLGRTRLAARLAPATAGIRPFISVLDERTPGDRQFLLGRRPSFGDILDGFAARREVMTLVERTATSRMDLIAVTGPAGTGKSTLLMQYAIKRHLGGSVVAWVGNDFRPSLPQLIASIDSSGATCVVIDDIDMYGESAKRVINKVSEELGPGGVLVVGVRSIRYDRIAGMMGLREVSVDRVTEGDAREVVRVLRAANAVADQRLSDQELAEQLWKDSGTDLLVGLSRATTGMLLVERIQSECSMLTRDELLVYGCISLLTAELESLTIDQVQLATNLSGRASWNAISRLKSARMIVQASSSARLITRHRVVAEHVRAFMRDKGYLADVVGGCLYALASSAADVRSLGEVDRRALIRMLSHTYLISELGLAANEIRSIYDSVEQSLAEDFQYWLQRGSFELEKGTDEEATHCLMSARTLPGGQDDFKVLTSFAILRLRVASALVSPETLRLGIDAVEDLVKVLRVRGAASPHSVVVLSRDGVPWLADADVLSEKKIELLSDCAGVLGGVQGLDRVNKQVARWRPGAVLLIRDVLSPPTSTT